jgi:tetratricopeptide (TPR) repeat protein
MNTTVAALADAPAAAAAAGDGVGRLVPWQVPAVRVNDTPTTLRLEMPSVRMSVPVSRVGEIVGRESTVKQVTAALAPLGARVLIYGPPGVGKDTVMAEVAHSIDVQSFGGLQAWLQASSDAVLRRQLIELFATHRPRVVARMDNDANAAIAAIKQWLATHDDWVLFVEDAGPSSATVWDVLPGRGVGGRVLVTSQATLGGRTMFEQQGARIELAPITTDESVALLVNSNVLSKKTPSPPDGETEDELRTRCADAGAADCYKPAPPDEKTKDCKQRRKETETALFVRSELGRPEMRAFLKDTLGNLPLSVALCGHMIRADPRVGSVLDLIALFKRTADLAEVDRAGHNPMLDKHYYGLYLSVKINLDRLRCAEGVADVDRDGAVTLLAMMSLLDRAQTPVSLLSGHNVVNVVHRATCDLAACMVGTRGSECESTVCSRRRRLATLLSDQGALERARRLCIEHGLMQEAVGGEGHGEGTVGVMHQLVQRCLRHELVVLSAVGGDVVSIVRNVVLSRFDYDTAKTPPARWLELRRMVPCIQAWADNVMGEVDGDNDRQELGEVQPTVSMADGDVAVLSRWGTMMLSADGDAKSAVRFFERLLARVKKALTSRHPGIATSMSNLATAYSALGRHEDALKLQNEVLSFERDVLSPTDPSIATSMSNLAITYSALGRHKDALKMNEKVLAFRRDVLLPKHPDIAKSMHNLASTYSALGLHEDALKLKEAVLAFQRDVLPAKHPDIATSMSNLAMTLSALGRHEDALKLKEEVLAFRRDVLPPTHPDIATSMNNLAASYSALGRHKDALKVKEKVLAFDRDVLPPKHPHIAASMINLATTYSDLGRYEDARKLNEEALAFQRNVLPPTHPDIAKSMNNLAMVCWKLGDTKTAVRNFKSAIEVFDRAGYAPDHPQMVTCKNNLAYMLRESQTGSAPPPPAPRAHSKKTKPNESCPCGSGKKYKKCCMHRSG